MKLYEIALANRRGCASPFVWRIKMLLAHLGVEYQSEMVFQIEIKEKLAFAQPEAERLGSKAPYAPNGTCPVLVDGDRILPDSWSIAAYLDKHYGDGSLVNTPTAYAMNRFFDSWATKHISGVMFLSILQDVVDALDEADKVFFRNTREQLLGLNFDELQGRLEDCLPALHENLSTLEDALSYTDFLGGDAPNYADYIVFSLFMWVANVSTVEVLNTQSAVYRWRERLMDAYGGMARVNSLAGRLA